MMFSQLKLEPSTEEVSVRIGNDLLKPHVAAFQCENNIKAVSITIIT